MYAIYNAESVKKIVNTTNNYTQTTWNQTLFATKIKYWYNWYLSVQGTAHYAINSKVYIKTPRKNIQNCMKKLLEDYKFIQIL